MKLAAVLDQLSLEGSLLLRTEFLGQHASDVRLDQCRLDHIDLTGAELTRTLFQDSVIVAGSWANLRSEKVRIRRVEFDGVRMTGADLSSSVLEDVSFSDCRIDLGSFE